MALNSLESNEHLFIYDKFRMTSMEDKRQKKKKNDLGLYRNAKSNKYNQMGYLMFFVII